MWKCLYNVYDWIRIYFHIEPSLFTLQTQSLFDKKQKMTYIHKHRDAGARVRETTTHTHITNTNVVVLYWMDLMHSSFVYTNNTIHCMQFKCFLNMNKVRQIRIKRKHEEKNRLVSTTRETWKRKAENRPRQRLLWVCVCEFETHGTQWRCEMNVHKICSRSQINCGENACMSYELDAQKIWWLMLCKNREK